MAMEKALSNSAFKSLTFSQTLQNILTLDRIVIAAKMPSKKKVLEQIAQSVAFSLPTLRVHEIFDSLIARERLGTTALGQGFAIPHCRLAIPEPIGCFMLLKEGVDFEAEDNVLVDMLFALFVPEDANEQHLELLADIALIFRQHAMRAQLRSATNCEQLYQRLIHG